MRSYYKMKVILLKRVELVTILVYMLHRNNTKEKETQKNHTQNERTKTLMKTKRKKEWMKGAKVSTKTTDSFWRVIGKIPPNSTGT